jgi:acetolactate synthase-1/2/3 large subunit
MTLHNGSVVVRWLYERGIDTVFEVPGESFLPVLDALYDEPRIRVVVMRHESGAAFAAEAYAKLSGRPALCMATRGPGSANLSIGIQTAFYDGSPLLALIGMNPRSTQGSRDFQEIDPKDLFGSFSKRVIVVNSGAALVPILDQALEICTSGRPGPVIVGIPSDLLMEQPSDGFEPRQRSLSLGDAAFDSGPLVKLLRSAINPVILLAGPASRGALADVVAELAWVAGLPVFCSWRRFSGFDNGNAHFAGSIGLGQAPEVIALLTRSDFILSFGFALDSVTCAAGNLDKPGRRIVQIAPSIDEDAVRHVPSADFVQVIGEPLGAARSILEGMAGAPARAAQPMPGLFPDPSAPGGDVGDGLRIDSVMHVLEELLPSNAVITCDAGNFAQWLIRQISFRETRSFLGPLNGAMGYGLPAAVGVRMSSEDRPCVVFAGDGGFLMSASELETLARLGGDTTAFVFDNSLYGTIRAKQQELFPNRSIGTALGSVDFGLLGRASGWSSWTVRSNAEIRPAVANALATSGCRLVHFVVDTEPLSPER